MIKKPMSFGRYFNFEHEIESLAWQYDAPSFLANSFSETGNRKILPYGKGRSYGDSCLNENGTLLCMSHMNKVLAFDKNTGVLTCEAGFTIGEIIRLVSPHGWFVPVSPGTKHVTVGGAVANDVHGKNHHVRGAFGNNISSIKLMTSDGKTHFLKPEDPLLKQR